MNLTRISARHPSGFGKIVLWGDPAHAFARVAALLERIPHHWQTDDWRIAMDGLRCPRCGETNEGGRKPMVERDERGRVFCNACGKESKPDD